MSTLSEYEKHVNELERLDELEHQDVLLAIGVLLKLKEGRQLFSYLFKNLEVTCTPDIGMEGNMLQQYLGLLRAGNSVYKLACEADSEASALLLSKLERKRYDNLYTEHRLQASNN